MKIEIFLRKGKIVKFFTELEIFFGNTGGNLKQRAKCIIASEGWTPLPRLYSLDETLCQAYHLFNFSWGNLQFVNTS